MIDVLTSYAMFVLLSVPTLVVFLAAYRVMGRVGFARDWLVYACMILVSSTSWSLQAVLPAVVFDTLGNTAYMAGVAFLLRGLAAYYGRRDYPAWALYLPPIVMAIVTLVGFAVPYGLRFRVVAYGVLIGTGFVAACILVLQSAKRRGIEDYVFAVVSATFAATLFVRSYWGLVSNRASLFAADTIEGLVLLVVALLGLATSFALLMLMFFRLARDLAESDTRLKDQEWTSTFVRILSGFAHDTGTPLGNLTSALSGARRIAAEGGSQSAAAALQAAEHSMQDVVNHAARFRSVLLYDDAESETYIDLCEHVTKTLSLAASLQAPGFSPPSVEADGPIMIRTRPALLFQVLLLILSSDRPYGRAGGGFVVRLSSDGQVARVAIGGAETEADLVHHEGSESVAVSEHDTTQTGLRLAVQILERDLAGSCTTEVVASRRRIIISLPVAPPEPDSHG